ncbi:MAG TPA: YqcC family protein [Pseudomonadales bacterium]
MTDRHIQLASVLMDIEAALRQHELWAQDAPSEEQLASTQPFCIDTLEFPQWVQFVMLPRFYAMIEVRAELPERCSIHPVAEMYFQGLDKEVTALMAALRELDGLFG